MCGRINVIDAPLTQMVSAMLGIRFEVQTNRDLRPTQPVETVAGNEQGIYQLSTTWGIQPSWANRLIINAKAETVSEKPTFRQAFAQHRCLVPCSGWYEWRDEGGPRKQKYLFEHAEGRPLFMAAIWYPAEQEGDEPQIVTLTTSANTRCAPYHNRMPLLIKPNAIRNWLYDSPQALADVMTGVDSDLVTVSAA